MYHACRGVIEMLTILHYARKDDWNQADAHQTFSFSNFSSSSGVSCMPCAAFFAVASACRIFLRRFRSCFSTSCGAAGAAAPELCNTSAALVLVAAEVPLALKEPLAVLAVCAECC